MNESCRRSCPSTISNCLSSRNTERQALSVGRYKSLLLYTYPVLYIFSSVSVSSAIPPSYIPAGGCNIPRRTSTQLEVKVCRYRFFFLYPVVFPFSSTLCLVCFPRCTGTQFEVGAGINLLRDVSSPPRMREGMSNGV